MAARRRDDRPADAHGFLRGLRLLRGEIASFDHYPFSIPAIRTLDEVAFDPKVTFLVGENGAGKSTLIEAIAVLCGFNPEGGSRNFNFATRNSESTLHASMRLVRGVRRPDSGFFLRAESFFNVASEIERLGVADSYGGKSLHEQSHGESFLALAQHKFGNDGLYILDEPEAALSPQRQLALLAIMHRLAEFGRTQFIIATHSPILMAYPGALIYQLGAEAMEAVAYEDTEHYRVTRGFLESRDSYFRHLFETKT